MNFSGKYKIYKNGELFHESPNLITENGKSILLQYMAGTITDWASFIGVGAVATTASLSDYKLYYEITRLPVINTIPSDSTSYFVTASGTAGTSSITVSSSSYLSLGQSVGGGGISSSITSTITSVSGTKVFLSYPIETTFSGSTITFKTPKSVRFTSRLEPGFACSIYELGMFNSDRLQSGNSIDQKILTNFDENVELASWSNGTSASAVGSSYTPRLGTAMLKISPVSGTPASAVLGDPSASPVSIGLLSSNVGNLSLSTVGFSSSYDTAKLLVYATASGASITVTGQDNTTNSTTNDIILISKSAVPAGGPTVVETQILKDSSYNDILTKIQVSASSSASVDLYLDSLKLSKTENLSIYSGMVSRSVLSTPISKAAAETIDIEYELLLFP